MKLHILVSALQRISLGRIGGHEQGPEDSSQQANATKTLQNNVQCRRLGAMSGHHFCTSWHNLDAK